MNHSASLKPNELESGCARPRHLWAYGEENVAVLAVALLAGIVKNHPFEQGNKRVALVAARAFLINNGYDIGLSDEDLGPLVVQLAASNISEERVAAVIEDQLVPVEMPFF